MAIDITAEDPFAIASKDFFQNPFPHYERIRSLGEVVWSNAAEKRWIVTSYDLSLRVFQDQNFSVETPDELLDDYKDIRHNVAYTDLISGFSKFMLAQDPPQHTRVRKLANKAFTRAVISDMSARIENIVDGLLDKVASSGKMDLISDFAFPFPITVICEILGLPESDHQKLHHWSGPIAGVTEPILGDNALAAGAQATTELFAYLKEVIAERRKNPGADLLSAFIQAEEEGDRLTLEELLANMLLLIIAGHETTVNLIGNGMICLLDNPDAMSKLRKQPELIPSAVEEFLRYQSPVQATDRYVREDTEFAGQHLKKNQRVSIIIGAANRDPLRFDQPNVFNIERDPNKHLAFGQGLHFCLGAPLARFESKMAFEKLLSRLSNIELAVSEIEFKPTAGFRGVASLPITFDPA